MFDNLIRCLVYLNFKHSQWLKSFFDRVHHTYWFILLNICGNSYLSQIGVPSGCIDRCILWVLFPVVKFHCCCFGCCCWISAELWPWFFGDSGECFLLFFYGWPAPVCSGVVYTPVFCITLHSLAFLCFISFIFYYNIFYLSSTM